MLVRPLRAIGVVNLAVAPSKSRTVMVPSAWPVQRRPLTTKSPSGWSTSRSRWSPWTGRPGWCRRRRGGHGAVGAEQAEQVGGQGPDPGLPGNRGAAGQGHEGDAAVVLVAPMRSVSLPIQRPWAVATRAKAPTPRSRPGFQDRGRPLFGVEAAMPSRATAPGPAPGWRRSRCSSTAGVRPRRPRSR